MHTDSKLSETLSKLLSGRIFKREVNVDNKFLEIFFSNSDGLYANDKPELSFEDKKQIDELYYIIEHMLPIIEKNVIYLLFFLKRNQETTGKILNLSQEMVHYYKKRALKRIKLHYFFRTVNLADMESFLAEYVTPKQKVAMIEYFKYHDLTKIAKIISKMEGKTRILTYRTIGERVLLGMKKLQDIAMSEDQFIKRKAEYYVKIFNILKQYNSLHHTQSKKRAVLELKA